MLIEKVLLILNEVLSSSGRSQLISLAEETTLREDIGLDSFDLAELTVRIEDQFAVDIFESGLVNTVGEILNKINASQNG
jgi:acyl carrier protein